MFKLGIDKLLTDPGARRYLGGRRVAMLAHPASMTGAFEHAVDAVQSRAGIRLAALFGPQHGVRGEKQDNMVESEDELDPVYGVPVFSLYGKVRRPTAAMLDTFDVLLVDLQDAGCRIYTFLTTLSYLAEDCAGHGKSLWILDRPNPAGRVIDGLSLTPGYESFVGVAPIPMRHGLTLGEAARWYADYKHLDLDLTVIHMADYAPHQGPGFGWPTHLPWVNPSPNLATVNAARCYSGTVLLEGTTLSEGRGTTRPLELVGAPGLDMDRIISMMRDAAPRWLRGGKLRPCYFEPTFHKYVGERCAGMQLHTDHQSYVHEDFSPFRIIALFLKMLRRLQPDYEMWREFAYEYETRHRPIDTINGGPYLREWVDDADATPADLDAMLTRDADRWRQASAGFHLY